MRLFKKVSALFMVLALLMTMSLSVFAADFDNLSDGFSYTGEDTNVNINISSNDGYADYTAQEGKTYTISSDNGSIVEGAAFYGSGEVVINTNTNGVVACEEVSVTVNADVENYAYSYEDATLTVNGDAAAEVYAVDDSTIVINGNVNNDDGVYAEDNANVTVNGDVYGGVSASDDAVITINGNVTGENGDPDDVDYDYPRDWSDGDDGVYAEGNAMVTVTGNVTGGDSYGTYGYGGDGITVENNATVIVGGNVTGGNVTAKPDTIADPEYVSEAGNAVQMANTATVKVAGNVTGGNTNGDQGVGGFGVYIAPDDSGGVGSLYVGGAVTSGTAPENGTEGVGIYLYGEDIEAVDAPLPDMTVGSYDSIGGIFYSVVDGSLVEREMTDEELDAIKATIKSPAGENKKVGDVMWTNLIGKIRKAQPGDEITINVYNRMSIPASVIEAVREFDVKLIIQWAGGDDLVITKAFTAEVSGTILLKDLAELLK